MWVDCQCQNCSSKWVELVSIEEARAAGADKGTVSTLFCNDCEDC